MKQFILTYCLLALCMQLFSTEPIYLHPNHSKASARKVTLIPYLAENPKAAVIICPGGSYSWLDLSTEGTEVAEWLQSNNISAFVLRYRVASIGAYITGYRVLGIGNRYPDMLEDMEAALQKLYENAEAWNIDTNLIGTMGFSAGGHLALSAYAYNRTPYKPKFIAAIYPVVTFNEPYAHNRSRRGALSVWGQWNSSMRDSLSIEKHVDSHFPPSFLINCKDDKTVDYHNAVLLDSALTSHNIQHTYIQYQTGSHSFGASSTKGTEESRQWKQTFITWISNLNQ